MLRDDVVELPYRITENTGWQNNATNHLHLKIRKDYLVASLLAKISIKTGVPVENIGLYRVTNSNSFTEFVKEESFADATSFNELRPGVYFFRFEEAGYEDNICAETIISHDEGFPDAVRHSENRKKRADTYREQIFLAEGLSNKKYVDYFERKIAREWWFTHEDDT